MLEGLVRADIVVIGGGFTGVTAAWRLKTDHPGKRIAVLEADVVGFGASGRNTGMLLPGFNLPLSKMLQRLGRQKTKDAWRYIEQSVQTAGELVRAHHLECDYELTGSLCVATSPGYVQRLEHEMALARSLEIPAGEWLDAAATRALVDSPTYMGARFDANGALVNPAKLANELKRIAIAAGVEFYEHSPVTNLAFTNPIRAQTPHGAIEADKLVLATNAFSAQFAPLYERQCPIHLYVVLTAPLSAEQLASVQWGGRHGILDARNLSHFYRLTPDNRLLVGGGDARYFYDNATGIDKHVPTFERLQWFIADTFPSLRGIRITHRWGGPVSATSDLVPAIGVSGDGSRIVYSVGCGSIGIGPAILNGIIIGDLIGEKRSEYTESLIVNRALTSLPSEPLRAPLVNGYLAYLRLQDAIYDLK
ncbi:MAG TPA: FAD-binding oxidoreductase [Anaerolineae bacterium]